MLKQPSPEYRGFRTRGIRLNEDMLPELGRLSAGRTRLMLRALHAFDKAHAVMLCEEGLLAPAHAAAILRALRQMEADGVEDVRLRAGGGLHSGEQYRIRVLGETTTVWTCPWCWPCSIIRWRSGRTISSSGPRANSTSSTFPTAFATPRAS